MFIDSADLLRTRSIIFSKFSLWPTCRCRPKYRQLLANIFSKLDHKHNWCAQKFSKHTISLKMMETPKFFRKGDRMAFFLWVSIRWLNRYFTYTKHNVLKVHLWSTEISAIGEHSFKIVCHRPTMCSYISANGSPKMMDFLYSGKNSLVAKSKCSVTIIFFHLFVKSKNHQPSFEIRQLTTLFECFRVC